MAILSSVSSEGLNVYTRKKCDPLKLSGELVCGFLLWSEVDSLKCFPVPTVT
jgi:hypothetical protein